MSRWPVLAVSLWAVFACVGAGAQSEARDALDAEFAGAGARAVAMGRAFIGLADDATAAEYNPAGLRFLRRPEFCVQGAYTFDKHRELGLGSTVRALSQGRRESVFYNERDEYFTPSFASWVWPDEQLTVAVSHLANVHFRRSFRDPVPLPSGRETFYENEVTNNVFALSAATHLSRQLFVGASLRMAQFDFDLKTHAQDDSFDDWSPSANVGVLYRRPEFSLGLVYKTPQAVRGTLSGNRIDTQLPWTVGTGLALYPTDRLRLLLDVDRIGWSSFDAVPGDEWERDDVWRYHLGGEYMLGPVRETALFLRAGYMREESNALRYRGTLSSPFRDPFRSPSPVEHWTAGVGLGRERYQMDLAVDWADTDSTELVLSWIAYF